MYLSFKHLQNITLATLSWAIKCAVEVFTIAWVGGPPDWVTLRGEKWLNAPPPTVNCTLGWVSGFKLSRRAPRLSMQFLPTTSQQRIALHCPQTKQQQERGFCFHRPLQLGHLLSSSGWLQSRVGVWIKARHKMGSSINWLNLCVQPKGILHSHILSSPSSLHLLTFMRN